MAKRKTTESKNSSSKILRYSTWGLALIALVLSSLISGYYIGYDDVNKNLQKETKQEKTKRLVALKKLEKVAKQKNVNTRLKEILKKDTENYVSASHELDGKSLAHVPKMLKREKKIVFHKPRLAIIIDDVGTASQVRAIKSLDLNLTMSFLPPSTGRPNTPKLASKEKLYMIHLPMEALNWSAEEPNTLRISDSQQKISIRIKEIKKLFPAVRYINNHTGSKFTSNEIAMNRLIFALNSNNIHFVDSRTTAETKAPKVMKNFGLKYVSRDVFLDHHMDKAYVKNQIKKAIKIAKSHGTAIAIGHPHKNTIQALLESKKLLKDVDIVFINRLN
jgi:polysaccharide deacetylase 2 family uncharacterized protein YibQ